MTAKKRMVAKPKAIKAELQRRKHHRTTEVGAWLRKVVLAYYRDHAVPGNSTQLRIFSHRVCWLRRSVLVRRSAHGCAGILFYPLLSRWMPCPRTLHAYLVLASPLLILGKSRMRKDARTDLCGGRSAMVVPTASAIHLRH